MARKACVAAVEAAALGTVFTSRGYTLNVSRTSANRASPKARFGVEERGRTGLELALLRLNMALGELLKSALLMSRRALRTPDELEALGWLSSLGSLIVHLCAISRVAFPVGAAEL